MCDELELWKKKDVSLFRTRHTNLKPPMAGIKLICDSLVAAENPDPAMVKEFLGDMSDEVDRLTKLSKDCLCLQNLTQAVIR